MAEAGGLLAKLQHLRKPDASNTLDHAISALSSISEDENVLISTLHDILINVIKPLFAPTKNAAITDSGRANLLPPLPASSTRFNVSVLDESTKPWKLNTWCLDLLAYILATYPTIPASPTSHRPTVEPHFHLLVPPILALLDDADISFKTHGCHLLTDLCHAVNTPPPPASQLSILSRTNLLPIFATALQISFLLLPTLTPESDSLTLFAALYPAYRALASTAPTTDPISTKSQPQRRSPSLLTPRENFLQTALRHGILPSLAHCPPISHPKLATLLFHEAATTVSALGLPAVKFLHHFLPLLRSILTDPLSTLFPPLLLASLELLSTFLRMCKARIAELECQWWPEGLRIVVGCWGVVVDDLEGSLDDPGRAGELRHVLEKLQGTMQELASTRPNDEVVEVVNLLLTEDQGLSELFARVL